MFKSPEEPKIEDSQDALKSKHLKEGVSPIMACVGSPAQYKNYPGERADVLRQLIIENSIHYLDINEPRILLNERRLKNDGFGSYVISPLDSRDKLSKDYANCTGILVAGRDLLTGENISFLSHQYPPYYLSIKPYEFNPSPRSKQDIFLDDLRKKLNEAKERCEEGTIDAVVFGGNYYSGDNLEEATGRENYVESIELLSDEIRDVLGFEPVVIAGPKTDEEWREKSIRQNTVNNDINTDDPGQKAEDNDIGYESVFYDNAKRKLYIMRPGIEDAPTETYRPRDIKKKEKKWEAEKKKTK